VWVIGAYDIDSKIVVLGKIGRGDLAQNAEALWGILVKAANREAVGVVAKRNPTHLGLSYGWYRLPSIIVADSAEPSNYYILTFDRGSTWMDAQVHADNLLRDELTGGGLLITATYWAPNAQGEIERQAEMMWQAGAP
jgi:hypothetical protein